MKILPWKFKLFKLIYE